MLCLRTLVGADVDQVQDTIGKWIETNRIMSETRRDWASEKTLLKQEAELLRVELIALEEKNRRLEHLTNRAKQDEEKAIAEKERMVGLLSRLQERTNALESRVLRILPAFPEPLLKRIQVLASRIGKRPEGEPPVSVSSRMQALVGICAEAEQFNQALTVVHDTREAASGAVFQIRILYWGLAGAFAASRSGEMAQVGHPRLDGWVWQDRPEFAEQICQLIAVHEGEYEPQSVQLPVTLKKVDGD